MKILFVVDTLASGGAGRVVSELANELDGSGDVVSICTFESPAESYELKDGIEHIDARMFIGDSSSFVRRAMFLRGLVKDQMVTCMLSFLPKCNVASTAAAVYTDTYVIVCERGCPDAGGASFCDSALRRLLYPKYADGYVFQTEETRDCFPESVRRYAAVIGNPLDPSLPPPFEGARSPRIVMSGRLEKQRNYPMALEAFSRIAGNFPDCTLEIYGEGRLRKDLAARIESLGLSGRVALRGHVQDLHERTRDASLYLRTSDSEGMSSGLMEAMAMGLPVVSTDHRGGGARALIEDGVNGLLVPVGDVGRLAQCLESVLGDEALRSRLSANACRIREKYNARSIAASWKQYMRKVMS